MSKQMEEFLGNLRDKKIMARMVIGYIGSTCRAFKTRRFEHLGRSIHTGRPITNPSFSNIREHAEQENHPLSHSNFKIIRSMPDKTFLLIAESLHIKLNNSSLNNHATSFPLIIADKI